MSIDFAFSNFVPELQNPGIFQYRELIIPAWRIVEKKYRVFHVLVSIISQLDYSQ
jgi:hypothetical protein